MDIIQRKLQLIDLELESRLNLLEKPAVRSPLFFCAAGLICGILSAEYFNYFSSIFLIVTIASSVFAMVFFIFRRDSFPPLFFAAAVMIGFLGLGGIRLNAFYQPAVNDIRNLVGQERKLATIRGVILNKPRIYRNDDWEFSRFTHSDPTSSFYLKLQQVETTGGRADVSGTVRVRVYEPVMDLRAGDLIEAYCWLYRFQEPRNPGQFNFARYLKNRNIYIGSSVGSRNAITKLEKEGGLFIRLKNTFREKATTSLLADASLEEQNKALLEALLLGYRSNIDSDTYGAFQRTGLLHFISLSGMHLGILVAFIWWLCRIAGFLKRGRAMICIIALCIFLLIVPPRAPTLRAAIICFVFCLSMLFRRRTNHLNNLSLAAIILLLIRPTGLFEAGWQLSFASVLGILIFTDRLYFLLDEKLSRWSLFKKSRKRNLLYQLASKTAVYSLGLLCVGLAAWLGGAGILLYHFYTVNPLTSLWTVIVFPFVVLILGLGYLKIILSFLLPTLAYILGIAVNAISSVLIGLVEFLADLNISQLLVGHVPVVIIIFYYCLLVFILFVHIRRPLIKRCIYLSGVLILVIYLGGLKWHRAHNNGLELAVLDVGHGQAVLVQLPGDKNVLFDAGSFNIKDVGQRVVVPFLAYRCIDSLDAVIISHNDTDHINGIPEIIEGCDVRDIYAPVQFFGDYDTWGTAEFLKSSLNQKGYEIEHLPERLQTESNLGIRFIWPRPDESGLKDLSDNEKSLVSLIEFAGKKILLCSDIEKYAQKRIRELYPELRCDALLVPHHGSAATAAQDFSSALRPSICICSCDRRQFERLNDKESDNEGVRLFTARDGMVNISISAKGDIRITPSVERRSNKQ